MLTPHAGIAGLLAVAKELGLDMAGVSFHVGSGASNPDALPEGIAAAAAVFARAAQHGFAMRVLDIGGGFPGGEQASWMLPTSSLPVTAMMLVEVDRPLRLVVTILMIFPN